MLQAVRRPAALDNAFPVPVDPDEDGVLLRSPSLFVAQAVFPRRLSHGHPRHGFAAVIGVWAGYEDNHLFRRTADGLAATGIERVPP